MNKDGEGIGTPIQVERCVNDLILVDRALNDLMLNPRLLKETKDDDVDTHQEIESDSSTIQNNKAGD